jgi:tRNA-splicing ligase RtcB (3'-phosphate/5'-hydroxy nucleic acid ligase)
MNLERLTQYKYRIPREGKMEVDAAFYASEKILEDLEAENYASLQQLQNVATLPGIVEPALTMPDIHWGYGFPIGGVAAFDPQRDGVVSPGGVGFDINCLPPGTQVLHADGYTRFIEALADERDPVLCAWRLGQRPESAPAAFLVSRDADRLLRLTTRAGFSLSATPDHPIYTPQGMRPLENLLPGDRVAVHPFEGVPYEPPAGRVILEESAFASVLARLGKGQTTSDFLKAKGLLPLKDDHQSLPALLRLMGYLFGDGTTYLSRGKGYAVFYGDPEGLEEARQDLSRLGFKAGGLYHRHRVHTFRGRSFTTEEYSLKVSSTAFVLLMHALGLPLGNKAKQDYVLPGWLDGLPRWQQANFLAGLFGAELTAPRAVPGHGYNFQPLVFSLTRREAYRATGRGFALGVARMSEALGVAVQDLREEVDWIALDGSRSVRYKLIFRASPETFRAVWGRIGYAYNPRRRRLALHALHYLRLKIAHLRERTEISERARVLYAEVGSPGQVHAALGVNRRFIERAIYENPGAVRPAADFPTFPEHLEGAGPMVFDKVVSLEALPYIGRVYDLSLAHPDHNFVAEGMVVSNCGVRLLTSEIDRGELERHKSRLADALYEQIPSGVGKGRKDFRLSREELREVLFEGPAPLVEKGYGDPEDLKHIESGGKLAGADPQAVSERAYERGLPQLGTLGSGNHFLEVQYVDELYDEEAAGAFGLSVGRVTVLIHSGSRGFGHQVCQDYVERFLEAAPRYGIELVDRQLAAAPIESPEGEEYLKAMASAANFAFANRQLITHFTRQSFASAGLDLEEYRLAVLYDLAHNNAKFEEHKGRKVLVHRKGATRAFGPGEEELPEEYRSVGQPVLVPGDMGRYSFVLAGTEGAMRETFGSSAHGAGRKMGRKKAKKAAKGRNIVREMEDRGILVRAAGRATVDEEMSEAYKDAADVIGATHGAGIGRKVARLRPLIVVKG